MKSAEFIPVISSFLVAVMFIAIPAFAATGSANMTTPSITVGASPTSPSVGDLVTIRGTATGGNLTPGVQLWIFAGNYANITDIPVDSQGNYQKIINTSGFPPAYYYIFVQHPGSDTKFNINLTGYAGEVVNENTGNVIFNFTGNGSLQDNAAAVALSNALNQNGVDDIFAKAGVTLVASGGSPGPAQGGQPALQATLVVGNASQPGETPVKTFTPVASTATPSPVSTGQVPVATKTPLPAGIVIASIIAGAILSGALKRDY